MSYTYPHFASQSPVASYQSADSLAKHMEARRSTIDRPEDEESALATAPVLGRPEHPNYGTTRSHPNVGSEHHPFGHGHSSETSLLLPSLELAHPSTGEVYLSDEVETFPSKPYGHEQPWSAWGTETKVLLKYAFPILIAQLLEYSLAIASVVAIGHLGTTELAASTLGAMTSSVTGWSMVVGMVSALDALLPQAWGGEHDHKKLVGLWTQRMCVVVAILLIPILAIWHTSYPILIFLRQDPEVARHAALYLKWLGLGLPAYAFNWIVRKYYMSIGILHVPSIIIAFIAPTNAFLNYLLVWGPGPFKSARPGFVGAPIATSISRNVMLICYLIHARLWSPREAWFPLRDRESVRQVFSGEALGLLVRLGAAGIGQTASEWWSWELVGLAASLLGPVALASQSVLLVSASTSYQFPFALCAASSVRVGNLVGMGDANRARLAARISLVLVVLAALFTSTILIVFRKSWAYLFNNDIRVVTLVARILPLLALFQILDGLASMTGALLRVAGMQFTGALLNLAGYYVLGIPTGLILAFCFSNLRLGLLGLWIGLSIALAFTSSFGLWYNLRTDWNDEVEKAKARLQSGESGGR